MRLSLLKFNEENTVFTIEFKNDKNSFKTDRLIFKDIADKNIGKVYIDVTFNIKTKTFKINSKDDVATNPAIYDELYSDVLKLNRRYHYHRFTIEEYMDILCFCVTTAINHGVYKKLKPIDITHRLSLKDLYNSLGVNLFGGFYITKTLNSSDNNENYRLWLKNENYRLWLKNEGIDYFVGDSEIDVKYLSETENIILDSEIDGHIIFLQTTNKKHDSYLIPLTKEIFEKFAIEVKRR